MSEIFGMASLSKINNKLKNDNVYTNSSYLWRSFTAVYDNFITSTFRGWSTRLKYSGESIAAFIAYFVAEYSGYTVRLSVRKDSDHSVIVYKD